MSSLRARTRAVVLLLASSALTASCSGTRSAGSDPSLTMIPVTIPATNATTAPLLPTDALAMPDATPETYSQLLTQLRGTPVIVNIWGSWCAPCQREAPHLGAAADRYGGQIQFVGVDILDTKTSAREFMETYGWTYPSLFDPSPSGAIRSSLGYLGQPVTLFYDAQGELVSDWEGALSSEILDDHIQQILPAEASQGS